MKNFKITSTERRGLIALIVLMIVAYAGADTLETGVVKWILIISALLPILTVVIINFLSPKEMTKRDIINERLGIEIKTSRYGEIEVSSKLYNNNKVYRNKA